MKRGNGEGVVGYSLPVKNQERTPSAILIERKNLPKMILELLLPFLIPEADADAVADELLLLLASVPSMRHLLFRPWLITVSFHLPAGRSPQQWTVMKGQLAKPMRELSIGRTASSVEVVPAGEVRRISMSPRLYAVRFTFTWTCSR
ncbi:hypothetical protein TYRP_005597 [Tyrophagus putrescentiae]|nr:hypothetical protein TYRP_005597 [Tyrophagus putrescentiae]